MNAGVLHNETAVERERDEVLISITAIIATVYTAEMS